MAKNDFSLSGKRALVFGGTSGIGKTIALGMATYGAEVVAVSRKESEVAKTASEIESHGRRTFVQTADVRDRDQIRQAAIRMQREFGGIDILVNSAGTITRVPSLEATPDDWQSILDVNLNGTWWASQIVGELMKDQGGGCIISIASIASFVALYEATAYCVSKAGLAMLTKCLALEWAKFGIRVNAIAPGVFETQLNTRLINDPHRKASILSRTPMKRFGNLTELVGAAIFLASDSASFVTGEILCVDGGFLAQGIGP